jgi:hypothetical protein
MKTKGKHYRFTVEFEAWIVKDISNAYRAYVRYGKEMHWNRFDNVKAALAWIGSCKPLN